VPALALRQLAADEGADDRSDQDARGDHLLDAAPDPEVLRDLQERARDDAGVVAVQQSRDCADDRGHQDDAGDLRVLVVATGDLATGSGRVPCFAHIGLRDQLRSAMWCKGTDAESSTAASGSMHGLEHREVSAPGVDSQAEELNSAMCARLSIQSTE
jgi:hypothetical protein